MKTVLIVDDERLFLSSLADVLPSYFEDLKVLTAEDGSEAIITLHTEEVDLVVTDLKMPLMDGFQLLVYMLNKQINIPVVVMTAFGTPDIEQQ
ncbi:MAG TPA: response regulator, partial [Acidobacteriota bacterium]|nr:response regulator [Acidobacteriota bacterium]